MNKNRKGIKTNEQENQIIRTQAKHAKFVPLIVMLILIGIISAITIGIQITNNKNKHIAETKGNTEQISAATDVAATSVGTNVKASFNGTTGEVSIYSTSGIGSIDNSKLNTFWSKCGQDNIKTITFSNEVYAPSNSHELFYYYDGKGGIAGLVNLTTFNNLNNLDTSKVTDMTRMFASCSSIKTLDLSSFRTSNVTKMNEMFKVCSSLESINIEGWDVSNLTETREMFEKCSNLRVVDLSTWYNVDANWHDASFMFAECSSLRSVVTPTWGGKFYSLMGMFRGCSSLESVTIKPGAARSFISMFEGCSNLRNVKFVSSNSEFEGDYNVSSSNFNQMFKNCSSLTVVDLRGIYTDTSSTYDANYTTDDPSDYNPFRGCEKLTDVYYPCFYRKGFVGKSRLGIL